MTITFDSSQPVGEIVAAFPGASNLFKANRIEFCCAGGKSLSAALAERGIPEEPFMAALVQAYEEIQYRQDSAATDWREAPVDQLIDHIAGVHHHYLRQEVPLLAGFTAKIARVHGERHPELVTLNQLFIELATLMEPQLRAEESELFPMLRASEDLGGALERMTAVTNGHQAAMALVEGMRKATDGYRLPPDACRTYTVAFQKLSDLDADLTTHMHLENNVLFARMRKQAELAGL